MLWIILIVISCLILPIPLVLGQTSIVTLSHPFLVGNDRKVVDNPIVGQPAAISTIVHNPTDQEQSMTVLLEARTDNDVTVRLVALKISVNGDFQVATAWEPQQSGEHALRTFAITSLEDPEVLTEVKTSIVNVTCC
jgi:hypothetical protein